LNFTTALSAVGMFSRGKRAPDRKKRGMMRKLIIRGKACMSSSCEAMAVPRAVNRTAIRNMNRNIGIIPMSDEGRKPMSIETRKTIVPWNIEIVAPPRVLPSMIFVRETGATSVSFRKPNWRSQITSMPVNIAEKRTAMPIIPGARNWI
jgi:hypothetical protein